ncbi:uroporphyrinogen-iii decarboxylase [Dunaliella salina]|uniref:Uroporphyrinogen decarboxylase n=1 Tax=Dunaliella salina TaxID=3046 RepID=A0ABQ7GZ06_DUNSA|nr:uroporphyrinogen-iii decarboxylase [Dunaliella salina]|eukprot:KAF5839842.1 uroporphyrinogen-iii decarboxylase [Dunaliella salina]
MQSFANRQCGRSIVRGFSSPQIAAQPRRDRCLTASAAAEQPAVAAQEGGAAAPSSNDPLMLRALRGEAVERPPVWMMRQAGRYMKVYQELVKKHPSFRERSEKVELSVEITLQPWHAFKPDGVVLFSDILTPLPGMNISFDIGQGTGPVIPEPIRTMEQVDKVTKLNAEATCPFVGESLKQVRQAVDGQAAVLGFVGAPFTLATYIVEGGSSKNFHNLKRMAFGSPEVLHALLEKLADNVADYCRYQADHGAQVVQVFDSWASHLMPQDFEVFAAPYTKKVIDSFRSTHPHVPIILYISGGGGLLERMAACGPDCISLDQSVDIAEGIDRIGTGFAVQGNMDPGILFGSRETIEARVMDVIQKARSKGVRHVMNLGHGVLPGTPEESVATYFEVARTAHQRW